MDPPSGCPEARHSYTGGHRRTLHGAGLPTEAAAPRKKEECKRKEEEEEKELSQIEKKDEETMKKKRSVEPLKTTGQVIIEETKTP